jgi:hypothetical protein
LHAQVASRAGRCDLEAGEVQGMGKVFFFLFLVVAIWTGLEVMNNGMGGAFGGLLARVGLASPAGESEPALRERAAGAVEDAVRRSEERASRPTE